jgi:hypothetical protein
VDNVSEEVPFQTIFIALEEGRSILSKAAAAQHRTTPDQE